MESRLNKPRVFLSHSKADSVFIERLDADLRACQVDTWLDTIDIPHGRPWLDAIFEDGIPGCDAVVVYFTESSLGSAMVKKEIDAAILQQLKDRRVAFLPYVSSAPVRGQLRVDIQALQTPVWNSGNYAELLPRVVAEIWRSYLDRTVASAVQDEKVRRLQAELDLESLRNQSTGSVFSSAEEAEFRYIWNALDREAIVEVQEHTRSDEKSPWGPTRIFKVPVLLTTFVALSITAGYEFSYREAHSVLDGPVVDLIAPRETQIAADTKFIVSETPTLTDELTMYGLLERVHETQTPASESSPFRRLSLFGGPQYWHIWTAKSQRLRYWLAYCQLLPDALVFGDWVEEASV